MNLQTVRININQAALALDRARKEMESGTGITVVEGLQEALDAVHLAKKAVALAMTRVNQTHVRRTQVSIDPWRQGSRPNSMPETYPHSHKEAS